SELESHFLRESREEEQATARFLPPQIDRERAHNCTIMLSNVKIPFNELMDHVLALDNSVLDADQLDNIIQFCPTKEEMDQLKDYKGDRDELGKCEQFFLELMKVPRAEYKLIAFSYMLRFKSLVS
ncbi:formin-like protein 13 isoform X6, partial [Tanacetum coccineum]